MPYGVTDEQWAVMNDYGRYLAKQAWEKKQGATATAPKTSSNNPYGVPSAAWESLPEGAKARAISTGGHSFEGYPGAAEQPIAPEQPIAAEQPIVQQPTFDPYDYIRELQKAQRQQQIAAIQAAQQRALSGLESTYTGRQGALGRALSSSETNLETGLQRTLSALDTEHAKIDPYYYDARRQAQSASDIGKLNFAQYMAGRGIKGAAAGLPEIYRNISLQGELGALGRQETAAKGEIERARSTAQEQYNTMLSNLRNQYASDLSLLEQEYLKAKEGIAEAYSQDRLAAEAGISAQGLQAYIDQMNADRLFSLNEAQLTGRYGDQFTLPAITTLAYLTGYLPGGTPTLQGLQFMQGIQDKERQQWLDTIGRFSDNYQAEINRVMNDNDPSNDWQIAYLQAARQQKIQQQQAEEAAQAAAASEAQKQRYKDALELWKMYGQATPEIAAILGVPVGARTANYDIDKLNAYIDQQKVNIDQQKVNLEAQKAAGKKDEETPVPGSIGATFGHNAVYNDAKAMKDEGYSDVEVIGYVKNSGLTAADVAAILSRLGYDDEDIDRYEAATRGTLYMSELQRLFNR